MGTRSIHGIHTSSSPTFPSSKPLLTPASSMALRASFAGNFVYVLEDLSCRVESTLVRREKLDGGGGALGIVLLLLSLSSLSFLFFCFLSCRYSKELHHILIVARPFPRQAARTPNIRSHKTSKYQHPARPAIIDAKWCEYESFSLCTGSFLCHEKRGVRLGLIEKKKLVAASLGWSTRILEGCLEHAGG